MLTIIKHTIDISHHFILIGSRILQVVKQQVSSQKESGPSERVSNVATLMNEIEQGNSSDSAIDPTALLVSFLH